MKILTAIDSFKGSMTSEEANMCVKRALPQHSVTCFPIADGGEGTVDAFVKVLDGKYIVNDIIGVNGMPYSAKWGWLENEKTAIIEVAEGAGIIRANKDNFHPSNHTSYGVGEQINQALDYGAETIILGLGGSATIDGGVGLLQALGVVYRDSNYTELPMLPVKLSQIESIDKSNLDNRLNNIKIILATDVNNPLLGKDGATYIFGKQKGLQEHEFSEFDFHMKKYADLVQEETESNTRDLEGAGAAGGVGFALSSFLQAEFRNGLFLLAEIGELESQIKDVDLIITGEGRFDDQSLGGKVPVGISRLAKQHNVPVILFAGEVDSDRVSINEENIHALIPIVDSPMTLESSMVSGSRLLEKAIRRTFNLIDLSKKI